MRDHIEEITGAARADLEDWIAQNSRLCELRDVDFEAGFPYNQRHTQALYLLRYYPAYFAENYMMFQQIFEDGNTSPDIASIGCGSLVDAAAASFVCDVDYTYHGYDINDWAIKGVNPNGGAIQFNHGDVFEEEAWDEDRDVFCFSRSLRDLGARIEDFAAIVQGTEFTRDIIYVCATYNSGPADVRMQHREWLQQFAGFFDGYTVTPFAYMNGTVPGMPGVNGIRGIYDWWVHPQDIFCRSLMDCCRDGVQNECATDDCETELRRRPIMRVAELAYEILKLER